MHIAFNKSSLLEDMLQLKIDSDSDSSNPATFQGRGF